MYKVQFYTVLYIHHIYIGVEDMKQWKLVLARTFHPTMKQLLPTTPGPERKKKPHNSYTLQAHCAALQQDQGTTVTLGKPSWLSAIALSELHRAGLSGKLLLTNIAPAVWHPRESNPSGLGCSSHHHLQERLVKSRIKVITERTGPPTNPAANC